MTEENLIPAKLFCAHYNVELSFLTTLKQLELIEIIYENEDYFIPAGKISDLEKLIRLHYEMEINIEGIEAVHHLLSRIKLMQDEINRLRNKLLLYEEL